MFIITKLYLPTFSIVAFIVIAYGSYMDYQNITEFTYSVYISLIITFFAGISGVICVVLVAREKISNYYFGIISVLLWLIYVVFWSPLIWDAFINIVYLILNIYGLYYWRHPHKAQQKPNISVAITRRLSKLEYLCYSSIAIVMLVIMTLIGQKISKYTDIFQGITDSLTTVLAILGQWFMARKILENWYLWIALNIISIPLYISINSYTLVAVWVIYLINSIYGLIMWRNKMLINTEVQ